MPKGENNQSWYSQNVFVFAHLAVTHTTTAAITSFPVTIVAVTCNRAVKEIAVVCNSNEVEDILLNSD